MHSGCSPRRRWQRAVRHATSMKDRADPGSATSADALAIWNSVPARRYRCAGHVGAGPDNARLRAAQRQLVGGAREIRHLDWHPHTRADGKGPSPSSAPARAVRAIPVPGLERLGGHGRAARAHDKPTSLAVGQAIRLGAVRRSAHDHQTRGRYRRRSHRRRARRGRSRPSLVS